MNLDIIKTLVRQADSKIVLLVLDGLGDMESEIFGQTALEIARTPHLDALVAQGVCGLHEPVGAGITPGSGAGHLALFGYDPLTYQVGRGVLSALGIGFDLQPGDVAMRGNYCALDQEGKIADRRAGRLSTERNRELCALLREIELPAAQALVETIKEHRFLLVLRGEGLDPRVSDTDPQEAGMAPLAPQALDPGAEKTARQLQVFVDRAREILRDDHPANMVILRGCSRRPDWPSFRDVFRLRAAAIAAYPAYIGLARLLGMDPLQSGDDDGGPFDLLEAHWPAYDFFYLHIKGIDSAGEDGDFSRKVALIEQVDAQIPRVLALKPDVILVTGDHSTPAAWRGHSWHPVPVLLWSRACRVDAVQRFGETACLQGALGARFPAVDLMPLALANAGRLAKFGA